MHTLTRKIPLLVVIISLTFLSAKCSTPAPTVEDSEQCSTYFKINDDLTITPEESVCNCRMYRFDKSYIGPVNYTEEQIADAIEADEDNLIIKTSPRFIQRKLIYCHTIMGWSNQKRNESASWYAIITAYWEAMRKWILSP